MRLQIAAVGKMKAGPEHELYGRFSDRVGKSGKQLQLSGLTLIEISESRKTTTKDRKAEEASQLLARLEPGDRVIILDEKGDDVSSKGLADIIRKEQEVGTRTLTFAIGGPDGHGQEMISSSFRKIRFGSVTWPHQLVRIMLAEQLYRAITIMSGHPYHRV